MVEDRSQDSCLSTRVLSESTWSKSCLYQEDNDDKVTNGKSALEVVGGEIIRPTKSLKLMRFSIVYDSDSSDYSLSGEHAAYGTRQEQEQSDSNNNNNNGGDCHSLFNVIGRENSIDGLLRCSRFDYGSIASVNRNFCSLVKSEDIYKLRRQNRFVEHWVYFSCQLLEWVVFDPVERRWMQLPTMPPTNGAPSIVAVVNNQLYAADHADMEVRKYDKEEKRWFTVGRLPERAGLVNGWGLAFRACGERLIVIGGPRSSGGGGFIELNSWIPSNGGPPQWTLLARIHSHNFAYNCAVMGC
ncbi:unnamed protein product [Eruca vesicaria subsp. sativa]|uniref:Uncharacterized protein n=1 Tax=Eruca vesicaria subsp. sativa TaxID=29727 RepID=A0ABC8KWH6_ERUVS|nr:unnamed protein product [Eruca vesicaria subsp. sativa]